MRWWGHSVFEVLAANYRWMAANVVLALVPLALAGLLFAPPRRRQSAWWWAGVAAFVVFLPNAPYLITDLLHVFDAARHGASNAYLVAVLLPIYVVLMLVGVVSYVCSIELVRRYLDQIGEADSSPPIEIALHGLAAIGVYLGRVGRQNSWQVVTDPVQVLRWTARIAQPLALVAVVAAFGTFVSVAMVGRRFARVARGSRRSETGDDR